MKFVDLVLDIANEREAHCRQYALELRKLAGTERSAALRTQLLTLADRYEKTASDVEHERESIAALA